MEIYTYPEFILPMLVVFYTVGLATGFITEKKYNTGIKAKTLFKQGLADPLTFRIHDYLEKKKIPSSQTKRGLKFLIAFIDNFFLSGLILRVLYGVIFIVPVFLTIWNGFSHGALWVRKGFCTFSLVLLQISYLLAGVVGVTLGAAVYNYFFTVNNFVWVIPWSYLWISALVCLIGSIMEQMDN